MLYSTVVIDRWVYMQLNNKVNGIIISLFSDFDLTYDLDYDYHHTKFGDCKSNSSGDMIFLSSDFWSSLNFGHITFRPTWPMALTFIYDLDIINGFHHTKFAGCKSNGSEYMIFCQVTFGPVWILVTSHPDRQKAMHKSPPCIRTGGLKNHVSKLSRHCCSDR